MKTSWPSRFCWILFLCSISHGKSDSACVNGAMLGWRISQRIAPGKYEIVVQEGTNFCGNAPGSTCMPIEPVRAVLIALDDRFQSAGVIRSPVWVQNSDKNPETVEMPLDNGFKKKFRVIRESKACVAYGEKTLLKRKEEARKEENEQRKLSAKQALEDKRREDEERKEATESQREQEKASELWK